MTQQRTHRFYRGHGVSQKSSYWHSPWNFHHTEYQIPYQNGVNGSLIDDCIKRCLGEVHSLGVHEQVFKSFRFFLIFLFHGLHANIRDVDIGDLSVPLLEHLLTESRVASPDVEDPMSLIYVGGDDVLEAAETLVPVKRLRIPS